ncbi:MAG: aldo/keto reductase [Verrucomicrobiae bacterium]|nr:aldo/keto reductase [Verrucomicrobiae bacterium]
MSKKIRWGILGTGSISNAIAYTLPNSEKGQLHAIGSRSKKSAVEWAKKYPGIKAYGSYEELLADPQVDAVYVALPNNVHAKWVVAAAEAGKHILCEKPMASNHAEVLVMQEAARINGVYLSEAFMWRYHPGTAEMVRLIKSGTLGDLRIIEAQFSFNVGPDSQTNRLSNEMSWGGIMDVGCYCIAASRLFAGAGLGRDFADPLSLSGAGHVGRSGVDEWAAAVMKFPGDIVATVTTGLRVNLHNHLRIYGDKGHILVTNPWFTEGKFTLCLDGKEPKDIHVNSPKNLYAHEADMLAECVAEGRTEPRPPGLTWADSLGQQKTVDQWRKSLGITFACETDAGLSAGTLAGRPLKFRSRMTKALAMPMGTIAGLEKPVARAIMGSMCLRHDDMAYTCSVLDEYFERGGNAADSAWVYGPNCEKALGKWLQLRGVRKDFVILGKGAHLAFDGKPFISPGCDPVSLRNQLYESLERLQTDHVDLYCMHRDNPHIPVGEFVDVLDELARAGRIKVFGGSNWTIKRFEEANEYARRKGRQAFQILSNNYSLAHWNCPMWGECLSNSDAESTAWFKKTQTPLLAWSSQASGFFTGAFDRKTKPDRDDWTREVARVWFNPGNFKRLERAQELAKSKKCTTLQIALAYVLCQPMNIYALIGPRTPEEVRTSLDALRIKLSPKELAWLNLETAKL